MSFSCIFSVDELIQFYDSYFYQCAWETNYLEIQSKNTCHYWMLIKDPKSEVPYTLLHKHRMRQLYHRQCGCASIDSAIKKIKRHDIFVLSRVGRDV